MEMKQALQQADTLFRELQENIITKMDALHELGTEALENYQSEPGEDTYVDVYTNLDQAQQTLRELQAQVTVIEALGFKTPVITQELGSDSYKRFSLTDYLDFSHAYLDAYTAEVEMKVGLVNNLRASNAFQLTALVSAWQLRPCIMDGQANRFHLRHKLKLSRTCA